jgi:PAS domain S-box-containing protein
MSFVLKYQADLVAFALLALFCAVATLGILRARYATPVRPARRVLAASGVVIIVGILLAVRAGMHERNQLVSAVRGLAPTYALELNRHGHQGITLDTAPDDPTYLRLIELQKQWLEINPVIADVYTFRLNADGAVALCVDSETDYDRSGAIDDDREGRTAIGELYEDMNEALLEGFAGVSTFDSNIIHDRWGTWVSAVEPIRDNAGNVYAVLGLDFPAETWVRNILGARLVMLLISAITLAILLTTSFMIVRMQAEVERRRDAEAASRAIRDRLRTIVDNEPECVVVLDTEGAILEINPAGQKLLGAQDASQLVGRAFSDFVHPLQTESFIQHTLSICGGKSDVIEVQVIDAGGSARVIWLETHSVPLRDSATSAVTSMLSVGRDVTARKRAEAEKEELQRQLIDASREAGMAEIATGVLHNVGNVLNSVNVSTQLLADKLAMSRVPSLGKLVELIRTEQSRLGDFVTNDERGKRLPEFLDQLHRKLAEDEATLAAELKSLVSGIAHIKEIVRMQQDCAALPSVVVQPLRPADIMEEALRVNLVSMERHKVDIDRDFDDIEALMLDKHKVLQILINLIGNAKQATCHPQIEQRQIRLAVKLDRQSQRVRFEVTDNGVGMSSDILPKLFRHGFTTKKDGHGFGLHSAANAAREMQGDIQAHSDGPLKGSTFTLQLPAVLPEANSQRRVA